MLYGPNDTFHKSDYLDIETDENGKVVAVWFRRRSLPFKQIKADKLRAEEMRRYYEKEMPKIIGIEIEDSDE